MGLSSSLSVDQKSALTRSVRLGNIRWYYERVTRYIVRALFHASPMCVSHTRSAVAINMFCALIRVRRASALFVHARLTSLRERRKRRKRRKSWVVQ